jgi:hypothetical protein
MNKRCSKCQQLKPQSLVSFRYDKSRPRWHSWCRSCENKYQKEWAKTSKARSILKQWKEDNPEKMRLYQNDTNARNRRRRQENPDRFRSYDLKKTVGITLDQKNQQFEKQGRKCGICKTTIPNTKKTWFADHDHQSGVFRGVLCGHCNSILGYSNDSPSVLIAAALYLIQHHPPQYVQKESK